MAVYFGQSGDIEIKRDTLLASLITKLDPHDVNTGNKRFSVDRASGSLLTGDRVEIATVDGSTLELVNGHNFPDGVWYLFIDKMGGIRLFDTFAKAISGKVGDALTLVTPSSSKEITIKTVNSRFRHLARVTEFEMTTSRDQVDLTPLGDQFKKQYEAGLISGQGRLSCLWEHSSDLADDTHVEDPEFPFYLAQLVLRLQQGADFNGRFYIYKSGTSTNQTVWYEANCVVTNVAVSVSASSEITTSIEFITNGVITLNTGATPGYLLQEDEYKILQEDQSPILLDQP
jgi:hypothetical protein